MVTTRERGVKARKEPSDSSASTTAITRPGRAAAAPPGIGAGRAAKPALRPRSGTAAPRAQAGSAPAPRRAITAMPVVEVLPWVPATEPTARQIGRAHV